MERSEGLSQGKINYLNTFVGRIRFFKIQLPDVKKKIKKKGNHVLITVPFFIKYLSVLRKQPTCVAFH